MRGLPHSIHVRMGRIALCKNLISLTLLFRTQVFELVANLLRFQGQLAKQSIRSVQMHAAMRLSTVRPLEYHMLRERYFFWYTIVLLGVMALHPPSNKYSPLSLHIFAFPLAFTSSAVALAFPSASYIFPLVSCFSSWALLLASLATSSVFAFAFSAFIPATSRALAAACSMRRQRQS